VTKRHSANLERVHAIVPLKTIKRSKTRLLVLPPQDRAKLTVAMLSNVLVALRKSRRISDVTVVSADKSAAKIANRHGAEFLSEGRRHGLNGALRLAIRELELRTTGTAMIIHADLPLLTTRDVDKFLSRAEGFQIAIVPCKNGTGTNALLLRPPNAIPPVFGKGSFKTHLSLAKKARFRWRVLRIRGIQFDIDDPRDLRKFTRQDARGESFRFLRK
jgi:2-phospho-L-lactate/phosphoenolpyruvate guanylyltransferase